LLIDGNPVQSVTLANTYWSRFVGLQGTLRLQKDHSLWLIPCGGIHTIVMLIPIDVVFLDAENKVIKICPNVGIFQFRFAPKGTHSVLEMSSGRDIELGLQLGQASA